MKINTRVTYNDGTAVDVTAGTVDLVAFEDTFDRSLANFETEMRYRDVCWLAWTSQRRQGKTGLDFGAWLETVDGVELRDATEPVPLEQTATTSESPNSP